MKLLINCSNDFDQIYRKYNYKLNMLINSSKEFDHIYIKCKYKSSVNITVLNTLKESN